MLSTGLLAPHISVLNQTEKGLMSVLFQGASFLCGAKVIDKIHTLPVPVFLKAAE
jgi:hypothetical protein